MELRITFEPSLPISGGGGGIRHGADDGRIRRDNQHPARQASPESGRVAFARHAPGRDRRVQATRRNACTSAWGRARCTAMERASIQVECADEVEMTAVAGT